MMTSKIEDRLRKNGVKIKKVLQVAQMVYDINNNALYKKIRKIIDYVL